MRLFDAEAFARRLRVRISERGISQADADTVVPAVHPSMPLLLTVPNLINGFAQVAHICAKFRQQSRLVNPVGLQF